MTQTFLLGNLIEINAKSVSRNSNLEKILYLDTSSVTEGKIDDKIEMNIDEAPSRAKRIVRDKDILISTVRPNLKHYAYIQNAEPNLIASTGFAVITATKIDPLYLYYWLTTDEKTTYFSSIADSQTSTFPAFNPSIIANLKINPPDLAEQKRIAKILGDLDDKIELNRRMNTILEQMGQALFRHYFIDNPEAERWPLRSIVSLLESSTGGDWGKEEPDEKFCIMSKVIRGTDIDKLTDGSIEEIPTRFIEQKKFSNRALVADDIIIEISGGSTNQPTGRSMYFDPQTLSLLGSSAIPASFCRLMRPISHNTALIIGPFLKFLYAQGTMWNYQNRSTGISNFQYKRFVEEAGIEVGTDQELKDYYDTISLILEKIGANRREITQLTSARDILMVKLFKELEKK